MRKSLLCVVLSLAFVSSGCSWIFQETLPDHYVEQMPAHCDTTKAWGWLDVLFAASGVVSAAAYAGSPDPDVATAGVIGGVLQGVIHAASARHGFKNANRCRDARERHDLYLVSLSTDSEPPPAPAPISAVAPPPPAPRAAFYCARAVDPSLPGVCSRTREGCAERQRTLLDAGVDVEPCLEAPAATCFTAVRVDDGSKLESCFATVGACHKQHALAVAKTDTYSGVTECADVAAE